MEDRLLFNGGVIPIENKKQMKKLFLLALAGMATLQLSAQNIDKIITRVYTG